MKNRPTFGYKIKPSKHSRYYYYIIEIQKDDFGVTEDIITCPLTLEEMQKLRDDINTILAKGA